MSIVKRFSVLCDVCPLDKPLSIFRVHADTMAEARRRAREEGWRLDRLGRDVCPRHPRLKGSR